MSQPSSPDNPDNTRARQDTPHYVPPSANTTPPEGEIENGNLVVYGTVNMFEPSPHETSQHLVEIRPPNGQPAVYLRGLEAANALESVGGEWRKGLKVKVTFVGTDPEALGKTVSRQAPVLTNGYH